MPETTTYRDQYLAYLEAKGTLPTKLREQINDPRVTEQFFKGMLAFKQREDRMDADPKKAYLYD